MEVSISSYNETDEQRLIRLLTEQVANQDKLIKKQDEIIEMQKGQIRTRDKQREVFIMYYEQGMTIEDIANYLGVTSQAVGDRLKYIKKKLSKENFS